MATELNNHANAARRTMQAAGLRNDQVTQVRGFADQHLRKSVAPDDPSNRRISVIVQYSSAPESPRKPGATPENKASASPPPSHAH